MPKKGRKRKGKYQKEHESFTNPYRILGLEEQNARLITLNKTFQIGHKLIAELMKENTKLTKAAREVLKWYERDGSVGGAVEPFAKLKEVLSE